MKILAKPSFERAHKKLTPQQRSVANAAIAKLPEIIGRPHRHAGIGIRPFGKYLEWRAGLQLRILFYLFEGDIVLATVGDHNAIARYVKEN